MPLKFSVVVQDLPQKRQHLFSGRGQADAALAPLEKRHAPFRLQIRNHLADGGLRIVERLRRAGKAARLHGFDEGEIFEQRIFHVPFMPIFDLNDL